MSMHKNIFPHRDGKTGTAHILIGYNQGRITDFIAMADELRKTFPEAKNEQIVCGKITRSNYVQNFSIIEWPGVPMDREYPGWRVWKEFNPDYYW